jgi:hypothetical protein
MKFKAPALLFLTRMRTLDIADSPKATIRARIERK